jgi:hypothetical protein
MKSTANRQEDRAENHDVSWAFTVGERVKIR